MAAASEAPGELQKEAHLQLKLTHSETHLKESTVCQSTSYRGEGAREEQGGPNAAAPPAEAWAPNEAGNQGLGVRGSGSTEAVLH